MNKITFRNNQTPALSDTNLNNLQTNVENEFKKMGINVSDEEDSRYEINLIQSHNLFNKDDVINGYALDENGQAVASTGYSVSKYIPIKANNTYGYGVYNQELTPDLVICVYGADKTFLARYTRDTASQSMFTAPTGSAYVRISDVNADLDYIQFSKGLFGSYEEYDVPRKFIVNGQKFTDTLNVSTNIDDRYKVNLLKTKNLNNGINQDVWINNAGNSCGITSGNVGIYLKANGGKYTISTTTTQTRYRIGCSNDEPNTSSNVNVYNSTNKDGTSDTITIDTAGYNYLIVSVTDLSTIQVEEGSTATEYTPFINNQINVDNEKYSDTINVGATEDSRSRVNILKSRNLFNKNDVINAYLNSSGTPIANNDLRVSNYIDIEGASTIAISGSQGNGVVSCFYNSSKTATGDYFSLSSSQTTKIVAVPTNAKYIRITINATALDTYQLEKGDTITNYESYIVPSIKVNGDEIYKKPKVLWENSNLTSSFDGQSVVLNDNISNYKYYAIIFIMATNDNTTFNTGKIPIENKTMLMCYTAGQKIRICSVPSNKTFTFGKAYKYTSITSASEDNTFCIPYQIIGY